MYELPKKLVDAIRDAPKGVIPKGIELKNRVVKAHRDAGARNTAKSVKRQTQRDAARVAEQRKHR